MVNDTLIYKLCKWQHVIDSQIERRGEAALLREVIKAIQQREISVNADALEYLRRIKRTSEMSAGIMRDTERTGEWAGAEKVAKQFDRLAEHASKATELLNAPKRESGKDMTGITLDVGTIRDNIKSILANFTCGTWSEEKAAEQIYEHCVQGCLDFIDPTKIEDGAGK